jgi:hypothetical protein
MFAERAYFEIALVSLMLGHVVLGRRLGGDFSEH